MKMKYDNIPIAVRQLGDNVLDKSIRQDIRFNYVQTLKNIKEYCDHVINKYEGKK